MKITKKLCIEAVMTEPLRFGSFNEKNNSHCDVCAVGAILRQENMNNENNIFRFMKKKSKGSFLNKRSINKHLKHGNYLHALSCYFENLYYYPINNNDLAKSMEIRSALVHFIEAFFPKTFEY